MSLMALLVGVRECFCERICLTLSIPHRFSVTARHKDAIEYCLSNALVFIVFRMCMLAAGVYGACCNKAVFLKYQAKCDRRNETLNWS